ncbi:MAG: hypothetical protein IPQ28_08410 [Sphingobacteriales bacterium]|nr:hypothetical protein [Sphingobacteriales bacterium]
MKKLLVLFLANYLACLTLLAQQPATTPNYPPTIDPNYVETPIQATAPTNYTAHILMHDGKTHYYIMLNNDIVGLLSDGNYGKIGIKKRPPIGRETEFSYMVKLPHVVYAVDPLDHVWQQVSPYQEIVGAVVK